MTSKETLVHIALADGRPSGIRKAYSAERSCICIAFGRADYPKARMREELSRTGVYLVQGPDLDHPGKQRVYMGRGQVLTTRLDDHQRKKDFWTEGFAFTTDNKSGLTEAHVVQLEARLIRQARAAGVAIVDNDVTPNPTPPRAEEQSAHDRLFEDMLLLMGVLGVVCLEEPATTVAPADAEGVQYQLKPKGTSSWGFECSDGFLVREGALGRIGKAEKLSPGYRQRRQQLLDDHVLVETQDKKHLRLVRDHVFGSPSQAASVMAGVNLNGRVAWVDESGQTLKDHQVGSTLVPPSTSSSDQPALFEAGRAV
ncbi:GIY-YIG nuclease family protein [Streptomyces sp. NPDC101490]|uniref:GIY-YIG nuclease family protein n=1 Tax=Streptomyces sp. NPDC101490 TaxID=3366143 RepID=UPI00382D260F